MRSGLPYDRPRIPEKLNGHHGHRYFSTEEARRQHKINSFMRSALSRMKRLPVAMCWSKWAAEIKVRSKCVVCSAARCAVRGRGVDALSGRLSGGSAKNGWHTSAQRLWGDSKICYWRSAFNLGQEWLVEKYLRSTCVVLLYSGENCV